MRFHLFFFPAFLFLQSCSPPVEHEARHDNGNLKEQGFLRDSTRVGQWSFYDVQGRLDSTGTYKNGLRHGSWRFYYDHGFLKSEGEFKKDKMEGTWTFRHENGEVEYQADFVNGYLDGTFDYFHENKIRRGSAYYNHAKDTAYIELFDRFGRPSHSYSRKMDDDDWEYHGKYKSFYWNGNLFEDYNYELGKLQGNCLTYHENGQLKFQGEYEKGLANGKLNRYHEDGGIESKEEYSIAQKIGHLQEFHENGKTKAEGSFTLDDDTWKKTGEWTFYHDNGKVKAKGHFVRGIKDQQWDYFDEKGKKTSTTKYDVVNEKATNVFYHENSSKEKEWSQFVLKEDEWEQDGHVYGKHKNGKPSFDGNYEEGKRIGAWKWFHEDGTLKELANYRDGVLDGALEKFNEDGQRVFSKSFHYDKGEGHSKFFHDSGAKQYELDLVLFDDSWHMVGDFEIFNEDGTLAKRIHVDSNLHFRYDTAFYEDGSIKNHAQYSYVDESWMLQDTFASFYENGSIEKSAIYYDGVYNGEIRIYSENENSNSSTLDYTVTTNVFDAQGEVNDYFSDGSTVPQGKLLLNDSTWVRTGIWEFYNEGKTLTSKGSYTEGKHDGTWEQWDDKGKLVHKTEYNLETKKGLRTFYKNGRKDRTIEMIANEDGWKYHGLLTFYHTNGRKSSQGQYKNGAQRGTWTYWSDSGYKRGTRTF